MSKKTRKSRNKFKFVEHFKANDKAELHKILDDVVSLYFTENTTEEKVS